jgi:hypothetical protein
MGVKKVKNGQRYLGIDTFLLTTNNCQLSTVN